MAISANTLFHFTDKIKLKNILKDGFHANYSEEDLSVVTPFESNIQNVYIPMVCFCDLPLHQIMPHLNFYGHYGIGLRKESWGTANGICPVHYIPDASISSLAINNFAHKIDSLKKNNQEVDLTDNLFEVYKLIKPFRGKVFNRKQGIVTNYEKKVKRIFYDEREWRFCPPTFKIIPVTDDNEKEYKIANSDLKHKKARLKFKSEDVSYIIVKSEAEIMDFAKIIQSNAKLTSTAKLLLISKLISVAQIKRDF